MHLSFEETSKLIESGKLLHIAGTEALLKKLPKGNWIGGSTEYFMEEDGCVVSNELLSIKDFSNYDFSIKTYSRETLKNIAIDAFDNGFSIVIIPFDSVLHKDYAEHAASYKDLFMKNIVGWISGFNVDKNGQTPIAVDGTNAAAYADQAVALHLRLPDDERAVVNIVNIFTPAENSPVITFENDGFFVTKCFIDGKETLFADYISQNNIDIKLPLIGDYSGNGINSSFRSVENGVVRMYGLVFKGVKYRLAQNIADYEKEFNSKIAALKAENILFSCNCLNNFIFGALEGKKINTFVGPITFGEIAYQLVNQTLVYVTCSKQ